MAEVVETDDPEAAEGDVIRLCETSARWNGKYALERDPFAAAETAVIQPAKIRTIDTVAEGIMRLRLVTPPGRTLAFRGGQYATIAPNGDLQRDYSIAAVDTETRDVSFYVKCLPGGAFSHWLRETARPGQMVRLRGPRGGFGLSSVEVEATWFLATGTGIVPIYAMIASMSDAEADACGRMRLLWGNRHPEELFLMDELAHLCEKRHIDFATVFSRVPGGGGRITDRLARERFAGHAIYVAGHPAMVGDIHDLAVAGGLRKVDFHADAFALSGASAGDGGRS